MRPCPICGRTVTCNCSLMGTKVYMGLDPGVKGATPTMVTVDGQIIEVTDFELNMGSLDEERQRRQERMGKAIGVVLQELQGGRAVMRCPSQQSVQVFGDPYTLRCFPRDSDTELEPGEVVLATDGMAHFNPNIMYGLRQGYAVAIEGPFCRWCAGDGIDARHSNRVTHLLKRDHSGGRRIFAGQYEADARIQVVPGIAKGRPINDWLRDMALAAYPVDELLRSIGRTEAELRCQRCMGSGR